MFEPQEDPDINTVWTWFEFQNSLLGDYLVRVLRAVGDASLDNGKSSEPSVARFRGMTRDEVVSFFDAQRGQLELLTMFELLATTEALLRIDFHARVTTKRKDGLSRRFREMDKSGQSVRLEDILGAMKEEGVPANLVADFRGVLKLRHWLAHGRHWNPKLGRDYTPNDVFDISRDLIASIPRS